MRGRKVSLSAALENIESETIQIEGENEPRVRSMRVPKLATVSVIRHVTGMLLLMYQYGENVSNVQTQILM
jgi:hypothetical protein